MKKKLTSVLLLVAVLCFVALPVVDAAKTVIEGGENGEYGAISKERVTDEETSPGFEVNNIYITKSRGSYIYITFTPGLNIKNIVSIEAANGFKIVSDVKGSDGSRTVLIESLNGKVTKETKILKIEMQQEEVGEDCKLLVSPHKLSCTAANGKFFIEDGKEVTEEEYNQVCSNVKPEQVKSGIPVPYLAVAGGILAIAGVYLYSRKQNKMFKI